MHINFVFYSGVVTYKYFQIKVLIHFFNTPLHWEFLYVMMHSISIALRILYHFLRLIDHINIENLLIRWLHLSLNFLNLFYEEIIWIMKIEHNFCFVNLLVTDAQYTAHRLIKCQWITWKLGLIFNAWPASTV